MFKKNKVTNRGFTPTPMNQRHKPADKCLDSFLNRPAEHHGHKTMVWGFSLVETMVALSIFVVVSLVTVSIFVNAVKNQRRDFVIQNLQDNARYIIEAFSKEVRMSSIQSSDGQTQTLNIINQDGQAITYAFQSNNLLRATQTLGSSKISIQGAFYVFKSGQQPRVTMEMLFTSTDSPDAKIQVQNTVTSRKYQ